MSIAGVFLPSSSSKLPLHIFALLFLTRRSAAAASVTLRDIATISGSLPEVVLRGKSLSNTVDVYYGVPYAQAEVWRAPEVPRAEQFGADALDPAKPFPPCFSDGGSNADQRSSSRHCLTIDVYTPSSSVPGERELLAGAALPDDERDLLAAAPTDNHLLPVFAFFTGSCFAGSSGTSGKAFLEGLARVNKKAIFVSVMHRAGQLGFAGSEGLVQDPRETRNDGEDHRDLFTNWALQDALAALAFVRQHILSFGGDPEKVTIWGQSSGACMVSALYALLPSEKRWYALLPADRTSSPPATYRPGFGGQKTISTPFF